MERMRRSEPTRSMQWVEQREPPAGTAPAGLPPEVDRLTNAQNYFATQWTPDELARKLLWPFLDPEVAGGALKTGIDGQRYVMQQPYDDLGVVGGSVIRDTIRMAKTAPWYELRQGQCGEYRSTGLRTLVENHLDSVKELSALAGGRDAFAKTHAAADLEDVVLQLAYMLHARDVVRVAKIAAKRHAAQDEMDTLHRAMAKAKADLAAAEAGLLQTTIAQLKADAEARKAARARAEYRTAYAVKLVELEPWRAEALLDAGGDLTATTPSENQEFEKQARDAGKAASDAVMAQPVVLLGENATEPTTIAQLQAAWLAGAAAGPELRDLKARAQAAETAHTRAHERHEALQQYVETKQVGLLGRTLDPNMADAGHLRPIIDAAAAHAAAKNGEGLGFGATEAADKPGAVEALEAYGVYRQWKQSHVYHACLTDENRMYEAYVLLQQRGFERQRELAQRAQQITTSISALPAEWSALKAGALPDVPLPMEPPLLPARISAPPRMGKSALILQMASFAVKLPDGFATIGIAPNKTLPMQEWFAKIDDLGWDHPLVDATAAAAGLVPPLPASANDAQRQAYAAALARYQAQHTGGLVTGYISNGFLHRRTAHLPHHDEAAHRRAHRWRCADETQGDYEKRVDAARKRWQEANPQSLVTDFEASPERRAVVRETRERWLPPLRAAFEGPFAVRMVLYSVNEVMDVRGINGVLDVLQERPESFVLKVYDESQFLSRQDFPEQANAKPREPYRLQAELRRTAPIMLGLPLMVSATQLAARFERVFYGPVRADTDMSVAYVPDVATPHWPHTQFRYQMVPLVDEHDLARARAIAPILPPSLRPRAFKSDVPTKTERLPTFYYGSTAEAPCGHVRPWTVDIQPKWMPFGLKPETTSNDAASLAHRLYGDGQGTVPRRAAPCLRPGMLNESSNEYRESCKNYPVLSPVNHGPKVINLEASMRLVIRHFVSFLQAPPAPLAADPQQPAYAVPMHVLATCRDVFGPLGMLHQVRLLSLYALWHRAQHGRKEAVADDMTRDGGYRQHVLRRRWGVAFVVVADCKPAPAHGNATAAAMTGGRPGAPITTWSNFERDGNVDNLATKFYRESASPLPPPVDPGKQHRYDPAARRFLDACHPDAGNLAPTADDIQVTLFLLDAALPRNCPRLQDVRGGPNAGQWHGSYPLFGAEAKAADGEAKLAMHPHFPRYEAIRKKLAPLRGNVTSAWNAYVASLKLVPQLFGHSANSLAPTSAAASLTDPGTASNYPTPERLADELRPGDFTPPNTKGSHALSDAGRTRLQVYYNVDNQTLNDLFDAKGTSGSMKIGTQIRNKQATYFQRKEALDKAQAEVATDPAKDKPEDGATHSAVYDGAGHLTDDFPNLSHLFDAWPNPEGEPNCALDGQPRPHCADTPWTEAHVNELAKKYTYTWSRDGAVRGDVRAFGCRSVAGAVRLAAALDIHRVCAVGYAKMASALTLQNTLVKQPFAPNLDAYPTPSTELDKNTTLCYVPRHMALASSEESGLDEMYQILGRTFVDMKTRELPADWKVELLTARLDDKATRGWPGTREDCLRATAPNPADALPTLLDSLRYLARLEHLFAEQPAVALAEMTTSVFGPGVLAPGTRDRMQSRLGERAEKFYGFVNPSGPARVRRPTARRCAELLWEFQLAPTETNPTATPNPTEQQKLERDRVAGMLMRRVGHRQAMGRTGRHGPSALWRLFYSDYDKFKIAMDVADSVAGSSGAGTASVAGSSAQGAP